MANEQVLKNKTNADEAIVPSLFGVCLNGFFPQMEAAQPPESFGQPRPVFRGDRRFKVQGLVVNGVEQA